MQDAVDRPRRKGAEREERAPRPALVHLQYQNTEQRACAAPPVGTETTSHEALAELEMGYHEWHSTQGLQRPAVLAGGGGRGAGPT